MGLESFDQYLELPENERSKIINGRVEEINRKLRRNTPFLYRILARGGQRVDRESSMLFGKERSEAIRICKKLAHEYHPQMTEMGGVDGVLKNLEDYLVAQLGGDESYRTDPEKRAFVEKDSLRIRELKAGLRALLDAAPAESHFSSHFHKGAPSTAIIRTNDFAATGRELLALFWLAATDPNMPLSEEDEPHREQCLEAEVSVFLGALADIRRGHNDDVYSPKNAPYDDITCPSGTFGKIAKMHLHNLSTEMALPYKESPAPYFGPKANPYLTEQFSLLSSDEQLQIIHELGLQFSSGEKFESEKSPSFDHFMEKLLSSSHANEFKKRIIEEFGKFDETTGKKVLDESHQHIAYLAYLNQIQSNRELPNNDIFLKMHEILGETLIQEAKNEILPKLTKDEQFAGYKKEYEETLDTLKGIKDQLLALNSLPTDTLEEIDDLNKQRAALETQYAYYVQQKRECEQNMDKFAKDKIKQYIVEKVQRKYDFNHEQLNQFLNDIGLKAKSSARQQASGGKKEVTESLVLPLIAPFDLFYARYESGEAEWPEEFGEKTPENIAKRTGEKIKDRMPNASNEQIEYLVTRKLKKLGFASQEESSSEKIKDGEGIDDDHIEEQAQLVPEKIESFIQEIESTYHTWQQNWGTRDVTALLDGALAIISYEHHSNEEEMLRSIGTAHIFRLEALRYSDLGKEKDYLDFLRQSAAMGSELSQLDILKIGTGLFIQTDKIGSDLGASLKAIKQISEQSENEQVKEYAKKHLETIGSRLLLEAQQIRENNFKPSRELYQKYMEDAAFCGVSSEIGIKSNYIREQVDKLVINPRWLTRLKADFEETEEAYLLQNAILSEKAIDAQKREYLKEFSNYLTPDNLAGFNQAFVALQDATRDFYAEFTKGLHDPIKLQALVDTLETKRREMIEAQETLVDNFIAHLKETHEEHEVSEYNKEYLRTLIQKEELQKQLLVDEPTIKMLYDASEKIVQAEFVVAENGNHEKMLDTIKVEFGNITNRFLSDLTNHIDTLKATPHKAGSRAAIQLQHLEKAQEKTIKVMRTITHQVENRKGRQNISIDEYTNHAIEMRNISQNLQEKLEEVGYPGRFERIINSFKRGLNTLFNKVGINLNINMGLTKNKAQQTKLSADITRTSLEKISGSKAEVATKKQFSLSQYNQQRASKEKSLLIPEQTLKDAVAFLSSNISTPVKLNLEKVLSPKEFADLNNFVNEDIKIEIDDRKTDPVKFILTKKNDYGFSESMRLNIPGKTLERYAQLQHQAQKERETQAKNEYAILTHSFSEFTDTDPQNEFIQALSLLEQQTSSDQSKIFTLALKSQTTEDLKSILETMEKMSSKPANFSTLKEAIEHRIGRNDLKFHRVSDREKGEEPSDRILWEKNTASTNIELLKEKLAVFEPSKIKRLT